MAKLVDINLSRNWEKKIARELPPWRGERIITHEEAVKATAFDQKAMEIIARSTYTTHNRFGIHRSVRVANIINDFFEPRHFEGRTIVEFGPGHYSFALIARHLGSKVICVDRDPIFIELGHHLGFQVIEKNFYDVTIEDISSKVDGIWIKGAFNAARVGDETRVRSFVALLNSLLNPDGWGWCVTVNQMRDAKTDSEQAAKLDRWVDFQRNCFEIAGWSHTPIEAIDRKRYALTYSGSRFYFTRGLTYHERL